MPYSEASENFNESFAIIQVADVPLKRDVRL